MRRSFTAAHIIAAVLLILFGAYALFSALCTPLFFWFAANLPQPGQHENPMTSMMKEMPAFIPFLIANLTFTLVSGGIELTCGIALFWWKRWARSLAIVWSAATLVFGLLMLMVQIIVLRPQQLAWTAAYQARNPNVPIMTIDPSIIAVLTFLLTASGTVTVLVLLMLPAVTAGFEGTDGFPDEAPPRIEYG